MKKVMLLFMTASAIIAAAGEKINLKVDFENSTTAQVAKGRKTASEFRGKTVFDNGFAGKALRFGKNAGCVLYNTQKNLDFDQPGTIVMRIKAENWHNAKGGKVTFWGLGNANGHIVFQISDAPADKCPCQRRLEVVILHSKKRRNVRYAINLPANNPICDGKWHSVAFGWDGDKILLSYDGMPFRAFKLQTPFSNAEFAHSPRFALGTNFGLNFLIDDFVIYGKKLSDAEIRKFAVPGDSDVVKEENAEKKTADSVIDDNFSRIKLSDEIKIADFKVENRGDKHTVKLPGLPEKPGFIPVLKCRMYSWAPSDSGCNYAARITVNDNDLGRRTAAGRSRLLFRNDRFELTDPRYKGKLMPVFLTSTELNLQFAPSFRNADKHTTDGQGAQFIFDLSDVARDLDVNTITFTNIRAYLGSPVTLIVCDASVGYLDRKTLNEKEPALLKSIGSGQKITVGSQVLRVFGNGGFAYDGGNGETLIVESALSMDPAAASTLIAKDNSSAVTVTACRDGFTIVKNFAGGITLQRTLLLRDGRLNWQEVWKNDSDKIKAIPFRHRIGLENRKAKVWLRGTPDVFELFTLDGNSTIFMESLNNQKCGYGIALEDDISRLICGANSAFGMAELYTGHFAVAPGTSQKLFFSVTPTAQKGYWEFINGLRKRWGIGVYGMDRPIFFAPQLPASRGKTWEERVQNIFGDLGPVTLAVEPWMNGLGRPKAIAEFVPGRKNSEDLLNECHAGEVPGHLKKLKAIKNAIPGIKVYSLHHASMYGVYAPEFANYALFDSVMRSRDMKPYHHAGYDAAILKGAEKNGWMVAYCIPLPGNYSWRRNFELVDLALSAGVDGMYFDEFSTCATKRDYSRYDYTRWDGFSADVNEKGEVTALKADHALLTLPFQNALLHKLTASGKGLLGNGSAVSIDLNKSAAMRFTEGASSNANMSGGHLSHVPLVLGNYGNTNSQAGILAAVRGALKYGCIYSPFSPTALYLKGKDNFVCKLYPLTVTELGAGVVCGKERIIVDHSGEFEWSGVESGNAELFLYNAAGDRLPNTGMVKVENGRIKLNCPENGLAIAELQK